MALCLQPSGGMSALGVHRIIERQSALAGDRVAIECDYASVTYRELNQRANVLARDLISRGLRRGAHAVVRMERSPELAVALLAVLKAGAAYTWVDAAKPDGRWPYGISLVDSGVASPILIDTRLLTAASRPAPNLPIITRAEDTACVLPASDGRGAVLVPHATIALMHGHPASEPALERAAWSGDATAIDLWLPLMAGAIVSVDAEPAYVAAA